MSTAFSKILLIFFTLILGFENVFSQEKEGTLIIKIHPVFNGMVLKLSSEPYINEHNDSLYFEAFKCYLSALKLIDVNGNEFQEKKSYHLINAEDTSTLILVLKEVPVRTFKSLTFNIGVDSLSSVSGALDGDLDPSKGMYWAWNTGYIDAKLIGHTKRCKTRKNSFEFHIGGYSGTYKTIQKTELKLNNLSLEANKTKVIELNAELAEWFKNPELIDLSVSNAILIPGKEAFKMAKNYADMFQFLKITNP